MQTGQIWIAYFFSFRLFFFCPAYVLTSNLFTVYPLILKLVIVSNYNPAKKVKIYGSGEKVNNDCFFS